MLAAICHRLPERSFLWLWDPPWLCARCTGFYAAAVVGALVCLLAPALLRGRWRWLLGAASAATAFMAVEKLAGFDGGNGIRCLTAVPLGFVVGAGLVTPLSTNSYNKRQKI